MTTVAILVLLFVVLAAIVSSFLWVTDLWTRFFVAARDLWRQ